MPVSTTRKPRGIHRGPGKRQISEAEKNKWLFMRKTQLMSVAEWDDPENFKHLPKPKKLIGNEATEIVWPYAVLLQNQLSVHPLTKSIYCFYFQYSFSPEGKQRNTLARNFARECLVPITFHNPQCYIESEMLLDYGEVPFLILHCLDENSVVIPIVEGATLQAGINAVMEMRRSARDLSSASETTPVNSAKSCRDTQKYTKKDLAADVQQITEVIGDSVVNPSEVWRTYHDRPLQNAFLKVNYQWFGEARQEREQHLACYQWPWDEEEVQKPIISNRATKITMALNQTPRDLPERLRLPKPARGLKYTNSQLDSKSHSFARHADNRAFSNGSRWGAPRRSGSN
ncbi:hypothetical protein XU18_1697 [Perkinsela sp. CCAP 1560/4]|nr:hypothetical protein XU18_1697 [Perkinsela sp. CCAP 1560/4]|eukprot:KNH07603.1 hypothetical protein XU18_1697 [Perkinsela sp. CCAP 1560/4]